MAERMGPVKIVIGEKVVIPVQSGPSIDSDLGDLTLTQGSEVPVYLCNGCIVLNVEGLDHYVILTPEKTDQLLFLATSRTPNQRKLLNIQGGFLKGTALPDEIKGAVVEILDNRFSGV